jgi:hypothetical protein
VSSDAGKGGPKTWSQEDMEQALDALRNHNMSLTKASATYGIPSTTLWQRAPRMGIDTPKKEGPTKSWTEENLNNALEALRTGTISANKASKAYGKFHPNAHNLNKNLYSSILVPPQIKYSCSSCSYSAFGEICIFHISFIMGNGTLSFPSTPWNTVQLIQNGALSFHLLRGTHFN